MNELINNLRLDAGISRLHDEPYLVAINKSGEIIDPLVGLEKFAELIVRECASIYDKIDNGNLHMGTDNYLEALQKHFGHER